MKNKRSSFIHIFKKKSLWVALIVLMVLILIGKHNKEYFENNEFLSFIDSHTFYNEKNELIDHKTEEIIEQYQAYQFIKPDDIVLELGGRYGSVSVVINKLVNDKKSHVVVEPDLNVIPTLKKNLDAHQCNCEILPKYISNKNKKIVKQGYGTFIEDSDEPNDQGISYSDFKLKYPQKFNVLIADCEGCLQEFLEIMGDDFSNLNKVIFEQDRGEMCNYELIKNKLIQSGFKEVDNSDNNRYVYMKN
jgi:FkbM family methyltransferase